MLTFEILAFFFATRRQARVKERQRWSRPLQQKFWARHRLLVAQLQRQRAKGRPGTRAGWHWYKFVNKFSKLFENVFLFLLKSSL
jgi:hypothetical protein